MADVVGESVVGALGNVMQRLPKSMPLQTTYFDEQVITLTYKDNYYRSFDVKYAAQLAVDNLAEDFIARAIVSLVSQELYDKCMSQGHYKEDS
jgi:hypothetical protein